MLSLEGWSAAQEFCETIESIDRAWRDSATAAIAHQESCSCHASDWASAQRLFNGCQVDDAVSDGFNPKGSQRFAARVHGADSPGGCRLQQVVTPCRPVRNGASILPKKSIHTGHTGHSTSLLSSPSWGASFLPSLSQKPTHIRRSPEWAI